MDCMRVENEFADAVLGDRRLTIPLVTVARQFQGQPEASFPVAAGSDAALEATYRFLNNTAVTPEAILAPHLAATCRRVRDAERVVVAHDTTEFSFRREGMGVLGEGRVGFLGHFALAVALDGGRAPLGVVGLETLVRKGRRAGTARERHARPDREEIRWFRTVEQAELLIGKSQAVVHVMDREAESYETFARLIDADYRFVIRTYYNRATVPEGITQVTRRAAAKMPKIDDVLQHSPVLLTFEVPVSARKAVLRANKPKPAREARVASVECVACTVDIVRPTWAPMDGPPSLRVNVVRVREANPPEGCEPIDWQLTTTEPVETAKQVEEIIEAYRARWVIEEYFRALKQGCAFEKRQLENTRAILNALAVFVPIAWQLLALRNAARVDSERPARKLLDPLKLELLRRHPKLKLPSRPTVREAMLAIAQLGGHITNNGEPGWIVLGRGYDRLLMLEEGALLAMGNCDQS
jgi:hypothetical protein